TIYIHTTHDSEDDQRTVKSRYNHYQSFSTTRIRSNVIYSAISTVPYGQVKNIFATFSLHPVRYTSFSTRTQTNKQRLFVFRLQREAPMSLLKKQERGPAGLSPLFLG